MNPSVTSIVLNYNAPLETMLKCLESLARQTYDNHRVLLVDNASTEVILPEIARRYPELEVLALEMNYGFSGGINRGVAHAGSDYVCLLNFDTIADPDFIAELVAVAESGPDIAGVAPKMMFAGQPHIFDSVGTTMAEKNAGAFNQAIGQPDIGQYDISEQVFGACFGAALLRREEFEPGRVGSLDESYFMYFEDVDWCFRANLLGRRFLTAPPAVVYHEHSASVKDKGYDFKFRMIELNLLRTVVKNYQRRQAVKISVTRLRTHLQNFLGRGNGHRSASLAIICKFLADLPQLLPKRWQVQSLRQVKDRQILKHSFNERPYYDPTEYHPFYQLETLMAAYRRLHAISGDAESLAVWRGLEAINASKLKFEPEVLHSRLEQLLADQPDYIQEFAARINEDGP